jgi:hypothetical protein
MVGDQWSEPHAATDCAPKCAVSAHSALYIEKVRHDAVILCAKIHGEKCLQSQSPFCVYMICNKFASPVLSICIRIILHKKV